MIGRSASSSGSKANGRPRYSLRALRRQPHLSRSQCSRSRAIGANRAIVVLWLSDTSGLRGHHLPLSLFLHIHVDASILTADVLTLPMAF